MYFLHGTFNLRFTIVEDITNLWDKSEIIDIFGAEICFLFTPGFLAIISQFQEFLQDLKIRIRFESSKRQRMQLAMW